LLEFLAEHDLSEAVQTLAALLVSELATNVVLHAHTPFALCAELTACELRVEVADGSSQPPVVMNPAPEEPGSRGMLIISSLADDWGVDPTPDGKLVWFGLSLVGR
jgi:anti-sigma regulatory factor (Ser/Thr protein kinase)